MDDRCIAVRRIHQIECAFDRWIVTDDPRRPDRPVRRAIDLGQTHPLVRIQFADLRPAQGLRSRRGETLRGSHVAIVDGDATMSSSPNRAPARDDANPRRLDVAPLRRSAVIEPPRWAVAHGELDPAYEPFQPRRLRCRTPAAHTVDRSRGSSRHRSRRDRRSPTRRPSEPPAGTGGRGRTSSSSPRRRTCRGTG